MKRAIVLNSGMPQGLESEGPEEDRPRRDYRLLADSLNAQIIFAEPKAGTGFWARRLATFLGQAWHAFRRRDEYDVVLTMSEQVGLPLALLFKLARCKKVHIMISHSLTQAKKSIFVRLLHVDTHIDRFVCYGSAQVSYLTEVLGVPDEKVELVLHPADSRFWRPMPGPKERVIVSAGLLARDYGTLLQAVEGLDVDVVIAAASPWVNGRRWQPDGKVPKRVKFARLTPRELRALYARSLFVVVPLFPVNLQAGSLVIYEAMGMGKAVVTSANGGNVDIVRDGETGYYVPPGDHQALKRVIADLLDHPTQAQSMGARAREVVEQGLNLDTYVQRVSEIVREVGRQSGLESERTFQPSREAAGPLAHRGQNGRIRDVGDG